MTVDLLGCDEAERIFGEACEVLETTGVLVENEEGRTLLHDAGSLFLDGRFRISRVDVMRALATAPSHVVLYDRGGAPAVEAGGTRVHFDPGSAAVNVLDRTSGRRRTATSEDVAALVRLVDRLPHYAAQSTALVPSDVAPERGDLHRLLLALRHGRKPVITGTFRKESFAPMLAMLTAVRGSEAALAEKPLAVFDCCVSPPLKWTDLTCQALIDCARFSIPAEVIPMPMTGATSPVTLRATLVQHCAENLSGLVIHQLARPGAPFIFGGAPSSFDMRHGTTPMGSIESMLLAAGYAQVGRHLRLPTHGYLCVSDAKTIDYQAGLESGMGALLGALAGINIISGAGMLDFLLTQSFEKLLLDHEACGMALRAARGIAADAGESVALISEVARVGEFLSHEHTRRHWKLELSIPSRVIDRSSYGEWEAGSASRAEERARDEVSRLLGLPDAEPLPDAVIAGLEAAAGA